MKVKLKTSLSGLDFSYKKGDEVDLEDKKAKEWIEAGVATEVKGKEPPKKASATSKSKTDG